MFKFKKIASVLASSVMLTSTIALAAAANYPAPFVTGGSADAAIVYGTNNVGTTDLIAVANIMSNLNTNVIGESVTTGTTVEGEAYPLFTGGTKLYVNDTLNAVVSTLTKTELPTVLKKGTFSGNTEATYEQTIKLGPTPRVTFNKQPTSSDNPEFGLTTSTTSANIIYNASITFSKAVNFTHADSKGQDLTMFGQKFTVASATDSSNLVLLKTAEKISLSSDEPTATVTIGGKTYTIELVSASDTAATIKVTDEDGNTETKEVNENASKKIQGVTVAVTNADETTIKLSASIIAGAEKVTLPTTAGSNVRFGEEERTLEGATVTITGGTTAATGIVFGIYAPNSDTDAIMPGKSFVDPIFGTFKLDFSALNIASDDESKREEIKITPTGSDKIEVNFKAGYATEAKSITWAKNLTDRINLQYDDDNHNISVREMEQTFKNGYMVVGNEESGRLIKVSTLTNDSSATPSFDSVIFSDVLYTDSYPVQISTTEGSGTVTIGGKGYTVTYGGTGTEETNWVRLNNDQDSTGNNVVLYPTIKTSKGAKLFFYKPLTIDLNSWNGAGAAATGFKIPDGDGYTDVDLATNAIGDGRAWNVTIPSGGTLRNINTTAGGSASGAIGKLTYNVTFAVSAGSNTTIVYLVSPEGGNIVNPALVLFEEKDDNTEYQALVVTLDPGTSSSNGLDVADVIRTWGNDAVLDSIGMPGNSNLAKEADLWGTIVTRDTSSSGNAKATISYPDEQIYPLLYLGEETASITSGGGGGTGGGTSNIISISDTDIASAAGKNIIVIGGSCVNSVAATLLGLSGVTCGADWTTATDVGSGQFLIQTFDRGTDNVATLVAGYNAGDTSNAATYLMTQTAVDTTAGKKYIGTSGTSASLVTETEEIVNNTA